MRSVNTPTPACERAQHTEQGIGIGVDTLSEISGRSGPLGGDDVRDAQLRRDVDRLSNQAPVIIRIIAAAVAPSRRIRLITYRADNFSGSRRTGKTVAAVRDAFALFRSPRSTVSASCCQMSSGSATPSGSTSSQPSSTSDSISIAFCPAHPIHLVT